MTTHMTRAQLLSRSARGGAAVLVAGSALTQLAPTARADPLPDLDIAASEAMHAGYLSLLKGRNAFLSFPPALTIQEASNSMDRFIA